MTATRTKYYFRKKIQKVIPDGDYLGTIGASSSTESDDLMQKIEDQRNLTLHVITDPGQSTSVNNSFQHLIGQLDSSLDVICVSERFKALRIKETSEKKTAFLPSLAVILFFKDELNFNEEENRIKLEEKSKVFLPIREVFLRKPWKFHHKVDVSGKLISCESNEQDFYEYTKDNIRLTSNGHGTPHFPSENNSSNQSTKQVHFPLWAVRRVHYGSQILRFQLFVEHESWKDQINFYKLILRKEEEFVRDDFCYFEIISNGNTAVQLGLKRLPPNVHPQPLISSILQFKVKNVGQLVPLLPNACEPISELRWRTRDHNSNLILLQIRKCSRETNSVSSFVKKLFSDNDTSNSSDIQEKTGKSKTPISNSRFNQKPETNPKTSTPKTRKQTPSLLKEAILFRSNTGTNKSDLGDSFLCPPLPEKMPITKPTLYFQTNNLNSSSSSSSSSEYQSARCTSPDSHDSASTVSKKKTLHNKIPERRKNTSTPTVNLSSISEGKKAQDNSFLFSSSQEGFFV